MAAPDFNLLITLDVLLSEGSVARAAERLRLSPSAMSRALSRLRETTGDPLLVRAGRGLVPTPRALALRERVHGLVEEAQAVLRPDETLDLAGLVRTFTLRTSDGFVENFGPSLLARIAAEAPGVRLHFLQKPDKDSTPLRDGRVDLETGVIEEGLGPEVRSQALFRDRLVGVVRQGHPLGDGPVTAARYAGARHVVVSRSGLEGGAVDLPFLPRDLVREAATIVSGFSAALALARAGDLVATVPDRHTANLRRGMVSFALPVPAMAFTVSMLWHPRMDADPAHRWLRGCVRDVCADPGQGDQAQTVPDDLADAAPYHAHVYYSPHERPAAMALRDRLRAAGPGDRLSDIRFIGELRDHKAGPHITWQFEIHFDKALLPVVEPVLEGSGLRVLIHPLTLDDLGDHTHLGRWIGEPVELDLSVLDPPGVNQGLARFGRTDV